MRDKTRRVGVERALVVAIDQSLRWHWDAIAPRLYVELRTMPPFELGLMLKSALRDALYDRHHGGRRRMAEGSANL